MPRGRQPGSKNRPKPPEPTETTPPTIPHGLTFIPAATPSYQLDELRLATVTVLLRMKSRTAAFGDPKHIDEQEIAWPIDWRLPQAGDAIHLSKTFGGFVEYVDFWPGESRVVAHLR